MSLALAGLLIAASCGDGVEVRPGPQGRFDVAARSASVSRVLECLAEQAGFRIVVDSALSLDVPITIEITGQPAVAAIRAVLDGQRLNYAYTTDPSGARVLMLLVSPRAAGASEPKEPPPLIRSVPPATPGPRVSAPPPADPGLESSQTPEIRGAAPVAPRPPGEAPSIDRGGVERPQPEVPLYPSPRPLSPLTLTEARRVPARPVG